MVLPCGSSFIDLLLLVWGTFFELLCLVHYVCLFVACCDFDCLC